MSEFTNVQNQLLPSGIATAPAASARASGDNLGQQDFMELLVAQLKNQDPAKPMDNFQFLSQIAQFGMVDGIQELNGSFGNVADSFRQNQMVEAASLLGREVATEGGSVAYEGLSVRGSIDVPEGASNLMLEIRSSNGDLVHSDLVTAPEAGTEPFIWDGTDADGIQLPAGDYEISVRTEVGGNVQSLGVTTLSRVDSVTIDVDGQTRLNLANGKQVGIDAVEQFR